MVCNEIRRLAYFYLDGTVGSLKAEQIETHVEQCLECGARFAIHRRVREIVRTGLKPLRAPQTLRDRVREACRGCD